MSISVIIPTYNYAHFLPRTLHSVLHQTLDVPLEIIVVDDGSTDHTARLAQRFADKVTYIRQENQGLSAARNTGMAHARGEALLFLDADDLLLPGVLHSQWQALHRRPQADITICLNYTFTASQPGDVVRMETCIPLPSSAHAVHQCAFNVAPVHSHMLRRSLAERVGTFDTTLKACEDYDYWLRCFMAGAQVLFNPTHAVLYRQHEQSMSARIENQMTYEMVCCQRVAEILRARPPALEHRRLDAYMAHLFGCLIRTCKILPLQPERTLEPLGYAVDALIEIHTLLCNTDRGSAIADIATQIPRTQEEVHVLQYYTMYALQTVKELQVHDLELETAYQLLRSHFSNWDVSAAAFKQVYAELCCQIYFPQSLQALADEHGALRIPV